MTCLKHSYFQLEKIYLKIPFGPKKRIFFFENALFGFSEKTSKKRKFFWEKILKAPLSFREKGFIEDMYIDRFRVNSIVKNLRMIIFKLLDEIFLFLDFQVRGLYNLKNDQKYPKISKISKFSQNFTKVHKKSKIPF